MNTLIVTLLIYRYKLLKNLQSSSSTQGFTLIEILVVAIILGILATFAIPSYMAMIDKLKYGNAQTQMNCMAKQLKIFRLENASYPTDVSRNIIPANEITCFPVQNSTETNSEIPFNAKYDYETLRVSGLNGQACAIFIVFLGKDKLKMSNSRNYFSEYDYTKLNFFYNGDDLIATVDLDNNLSGC